MSPRVNKLGAMGLTFWLLLGSAGTANAAISITCDGDAAFGAGLGGDDCNTAAGALNVIDGVSGLKCGGAYPFLFSFETCTKNLPALNKLVNASGDAKLFCVNKYDFLAVKQNCSSVAAKLSAVLQGTCKHGNPVSTPTGGGICAKPCDQGWTGINCDETGHYVCNSSTYRCDLSPGGGVISSCLETCTPSPTPAPTPVPPCTTGSCGAHQYCEHTAQKCECVIGWGGATCTVCLNKCNGRGTCPTTGVCDCDKGYGGANCTTFLDGSPLFPETHLVTTELGAQLNDWAKQPAGQKWALCYSSNTMNKTAETFHHGCDKYNATISVAHNSLGSTFGGYADATWLESWNNAYHSVCRSDPKDPGNEAKACYKGTSACFIFGLGPNGPLKLGPTGHDLGGTDYLFVAPWQWPAWGYRRGFGLDGVEETDLSFGYDPREGQPGGGGVHGWPGHLGICGFGRDSDGGTIGTYAGVPKGTSPICGNINMGTWGETQLEVFRQVKV